MKRINSILKNSIKVNHRDILTSICIHELKLLYDKVDLVQDRQMLQQLISKFEHNKYTDIPIKLIPICYSCNCNRT